MNKEKLVIVPANNFGITIKESDISTGKVVVNGVEVTDIESWNKAIQTFSKLEMELKEKDKEIENLNNIINETRRILGQYAHYSTPTEEQNAKNEAIVDEAYIQLHSNVAKELKEGNKYE